MTDSCLAVSFTVTHLYYTGAVQGQDNGSIVSHSTTTFPPGSVKYFWFWCFTSCKQNLVSKTFIFMRSRRPSGKINGEEEERETSLGVRIEAKDQNSKVFLTSWMNRGVIQNEVDNPYPAKSTSIKCWRKFSLQQMTVNTSLTQSDLMEPLNMCQLAMIKNSL